MVILALVVHAPGCTEAPFTVDPIGVVCTCDDETHATTLDGFAEANADDQGAIDAVQALGVGGRCELGGGGAPRTTAWRLA